MLVTLAVGLKRHDYRFEDKDMTFGSSTDLDQKFDIIYVQVSEYFS